MAGSHVHNFALGALVELTCAVRGCTKSDIARDAQITPSQLGDLISGRRAGHALDLRERIAGALGRHVREFTCPCDDRQGNHQEQADA